MSPRLLVALCALVVVAATAVRTWVAGAGWFYWDDLILHGWAAAHSLPGPGYLLSDHDGHLMPGGMALVWIAAHVAPLDFRMPLLQIALLQLIAGAAIARMLWVLLRGRPILVLPLVAALVLPLGLPAATWWSAALNSLPLTAAMAWAVASTIRLAQTGRRRHAVAAVAATVVGLAFVEKAVLVPVVAALVLLGWWWTSGRAAGGDRADDGPSGSGHGDGPSGGDHRYIRSGGGNGAGVWRRTRWMWAAQSVVLAVWAAVFAVTVGSIGGELWAGPDSAAPDSAAPDSAAPDSAGPGSGTTPGPVDPTEAPGPSFWGLIDATYRHAVVPTLAGGPWRWDRWHPGPPMADPPVAAMLAGALVCALVIAWSVLTRRRTGLVWAVAALYPVGAVALIVMGRVGPDTADEIVQTLRYHPDVVVVLAAALALALAAPRRSTSRRNAPAASGRARAATRGSAAARVIPDRVEPWAIAGLVGLLLLSSSYSTATYRATWADQPSRDYLAPLLETLHERDAPLLDADLPLEVLLPVTYPANRLSSMLAGVPDVPPVGAWTTDPVTIDATGNLHPAAVVPGRMIPQGIEPGCGHRVAAEGTRIALDGPLLGRDWIVQLNYFSGTDGTVAVRLDEGQEVEVPVTAGLSTRFVRVEGSGTGVTVTPRGGVPDLCIGSGPVGVLVPR